MSEPILSREEVDRIRLSCIENTIGFDHEKFAREIESALLEKLCGEPIYQVWIEETSSYADVTAEYYAERLPSNRRIVYAINRSKA
ncbi:hypothetical protein KTD22_16555 [Burkholderia multivorans]|uniref:hypothetical protein n=1 Tax=Burkholderia multivorans TaxID=87883 RepID=UPI001C244967|nr:hypothetical protein [Burkholderia multivorans]MBU9228237.1 hypothetical protein [Burkholderia multivorans]